MKQNKEQLGSGQHCQFLIIKSDYRGTHGSNLNDTKGLMASEIIWNAAPIINVIIIQHVEKLS